MRLPVLAPYINGDEGTCWARRAKEQCLHGERPSAGPDPPPRQGPKCLRGPNHRTSQIGEICWRHRRRKFLVPHFKGLGEPSPMCLYSKCSFFPGHSHWAPKKAATSDFVATSISPRHGDKCRLLLVEDPALKAQPQHEVAVGVFGPTPPPPQPFKGPKCLGGVGVMDCTWAPPNGCLFQESLP